MRLFARRKERPESAQGAPWARLLACAGVLLTLGLLPLTHYPEVSRALHVSLSLTAGAALLMAGWKRVTGRGTVSGVLLAGLIVALNVHLGGDTLLYLSRTRPTAAALLAAEAALTLGWLALRRHRPRPFLHRGGHVTPGSAAPLPPASAQDRYVTAVHEAGHLLAFGLAPRNPNLRASVERRQEGERLISGTVWYGKTHRQDGHAVMLWEMQHLLAGALAETVIFGESHGGNGGDLAQHEVVARKYLAANGGALIWSAAHPAETAHNAAVLSDLREGQERTVQAFLEAHQPLLNDLASLLERRTHLEAGELYPLLRRVRPTPGMVVLDGAWSPHA